MPRSSSVQDSGLFSDDNLQEWLAGEIHRFLNVEKKMTRQSLADAAGVNVHTIDALRKTDEGKRKVTTAQMLSLCCVMGERRVNGLLSHIGYGGATPLDEPDDLNLPDIIASGLRNMSVVANAAADGRIDHLEGPLVQEAADQIIATYLPLSSAGRAA